MSAACSGGGSDVPEGQALSKAADEGGCAGREPLKTVSFICSDAVPESFSYLARLSVTGVNTCRYKFVAFSQLPAGCSPFNAKLSEVRREKARRAPVHCAWAWFARAWVLNGRFRAPACLVTRSAGECVWQPRAGFAQSSAKAPNKFFVPWSCGCLVGKVHAEASATVSC